MPKLMSKKLKRILKPMTTPEKLDLSNYEYEKIISKLSEPNSTKLQRKLIKTLIKVIKINFNILPSNTEEKLLKEKREVLISKKLEMALLKHRMIKKLKEIKRREYKAVIEKITEINQIMSKPVTCEFQLKEERYSPDFSKVDILLNIINKIEDFLITGDQLGTDKDTSHDRALEYLKKK